ncbi:putative endoglucanase [Aspergillus saccharolyticus JOP 1030-1]|uniref:cellulase n=1 Tax=Aspergillus saccharolyticus JOP 1030-1 TaxID=1450539 RepID=A0A318Z880_9EURO|nr:cellulase-domain-containing protein [Aspergillus saccharolyticus JOP 1030-1]PYH43525.1 cellulase-domain-containing protein [Aspergillus saccharolyticus JOP 1030-1]
MKLTVLALLLSQVWAAPQAKRSSNFLWLGSSESGAEFGQANIPGVLGTDYIWPEADEIKVLFDAGMNIFRVPFLMERLIPTQLTGTPDATYLADLQATVESITSLGAYAVVDPHNFGRYYGNIITSTSDFAAFWTTVATVFASNDHVIFDTNNEYHDEDQTLVLDLNQAAITAIRAAGATSQYIFVEGNSYSGAWTWTTYNTNLVNLTDPSDKIIYEMHQYLDSDGSGTSDSCVSTTIGAERVAAATTWLRENGKKAVLGEFAGGANSQCLTAVTGMLDALSAASDVWLGALWWSAGPWWGTYIFSMEPPTGTGYTYYLSLLQSYAPGGGSSGTTTTTSVATATTTTKATSTTTTTSTKTTTTAATATSTAVAAHYGQCGGLYWTGPTTCASGYTCTAQNEYYSQCL